MNNRKLTTIARSLVLLITVGGADAGAATITITGTASGRGVDAMGPGNMPDGIYENVYSNSTIVLVDEHSIGSMSIHNERSAVEFPLAAIPTGSVINAVTLRLTDIFNGAAGGQVELHGYLGDGSIQVADLMVSNLVGSLVTPVPDPVMLALATGWLQSLVDSADPFAGLMFKGTPSATHVVFGFADTFSGIPVDLRPTLIVETQDQVVPEPGTIALLGTGLILTAYRRRRKAAPAAI